MTREELTIIYTALTYYYSKIENPKYNPRHFIEKIEVLMEDSELLNALREQGVDNWGGFSEAVRSIDEEPYD